MTNRICYEWDVEILDADGDIEDHQHGDLQHLLATFGPTILTGECDQRLVLIRNEWNELDGVTDRQWAYVEAAALPHTFDSGSAVPDRLRKELARTTVEVCG